MEVHELILKGTGDSGQLTMGPSIIFGGEGEPSDACRRKKRRRSRSRSRRRSCGAKRARRSRSRRSKRRGCGRSRRRSKSRSRKGGSTRKKCCGYKRRRYCCPGKRRYKAHRRGCPNPQRIGLCNRNWSRISIHPFINFLRCFRRRVPKNTPPSIMAHKGRCIWKKMNARQRMPYVEQAKRARCRGYRT